MAKGFQDSDWNVRDARLFLQGLSIAPLGRVAGASQGRKGTPAGLRHPMMNSAPNILKTKGQKSGLDELLKTKGRNKKDVKNEG
jgi:hypothetical protein